MLKQTVPAGRGRKAAWSCGVRYATPSEPFNNRLHQQRTFPSGRNGSVRVDTLRQSHLTHHGGRLLCTRHHYHVLGCILPSDRRFAVSSRSVSLLFLTNTLGLWPTVTIGRNGFIRYTLASGLQCNG